MGEPKLLYLSRADVESVGLTMAEIIEAVETAFREKGEGRVEMPPKPGVHPGGADCFIHAMPASIPAMASAGVKWVGGNPRNPESGLPYISGLVVLNDVETMLPTAVMDCSWITAMRTGAASAVAAKHLARPESSTVGILGCGVQGRSHLESLNVLFGIERVLAFDPKPGAAETYAEEMAEKLSLDVKTVGSAREAVSGCDIIITAGPLLKEPHGTIKSGWLDEGAFACAVDYDSYFDRVSLREAGKFCTDDIPQMRLAQDNGYFVDVPEVYADFGELAAGKKPGRETAHERIIAAPLGLAIDDMAVAPLILEKARETGLGTELPL